MSFDDDLKKNTIEETPQQREDWLEHQRKRAEKVKLDLWDIDPLPLTSITLCTEGPLYNRYVLIPDGTVEGIRVPINHLSLKQVYDLADDEALVLPLALGVPLTA